jgi:hypothetical protein
MKYILLLFITLNAALASSDTQFALADALEGGARAIASGGINDGIDQIFAQCASRRLPKEMAEEKSKFRTTLEEARRLGTARRVTRVSLLSFGEGFCRLRILDRRGGGAILWTFICEKDDEKWVMTSARLNAGEEIGALVQELDAADFTREEPKQP